MTAAWASDQYFIVRNQDDGLLLTARLSTTGHLYLQRVNILQEWVQLFRQVNKTQRFA